jgi:hypothetical protein
MQEAHDLDGARLALLRLQDANEQARSTGGDADGEPGGRAEVNIQTGPEHTCPSCAARFAWSGRAWVITDRHGRLNVLGHALSDEERPMPEIRRCPCCHCPLEMKATVEETDG